MDNSFEKTSVRETPKEPRLLMLFLSIVLGIGAGWYAFLRFSTLVNLPDGPWYRWIQPGLLGLMGILCLSSAILFMFGRPSAGPVFKFGLSIVPLVLFSNLVILVFRAIQQVIRENPTFLFDRLMAQPQKILLILIVLIAVGMLGSLNEKAKNSK